MQTLDLRKLLKPYFSASAAPALLEVPEFSYLMIDGKGNPGTSPDYMAAVQALYSLAYTLKFSLKKTAEVDYPVMALEGLWWADDMASFVQGDRDNWRWTMMILQPEIVSPQGLLSAKAEVERKKPGLPLSAVRLEKFAEGRCAQLMHIGPYAAEGPNIARLHEFVAEKGLQLRGKHHELYLGDPNRTAPENLRTILRQPVA
jgi:hypothetical protein